MMLNDFTKGGQTAFQSIRLFMDIFWKVILIFMFSWVISFSSLMYLKTTPYDRYRAFMLIQAEPMDFISNIIKGKFIQVGILDKRHSGDDFEMQFKNPQGIFEKTTVDKAVHELGTPSYFARLKDAAFWSAIEALLISVIISSVVTKLLMRYGASISKKKVLRGTRLCEPKELIHILKKSKKIKYSEINIGGIPLPEKSEMQHIWINGTTGSGKTVAFSDLLSQVRKKHRRAVVYDFMGVYVERFYRPGQDIILNPFDERSPGWTPWSECQHSVDYEMLAASQIPITPSVANEDPFWKKAARSLYATTLRRLAITKADDKAKNKLLLRYLLTSDLTNLRELLKDTEAEALVSKDLEKTALSVKAILNDYIKGMRFLQESEPLFSIREWVRRDSTDDSWLFITSRPDYHETLMPLISTWYDTAITEALSLPNHPDRRIYFPLDELPTLQFLPALRKGMTLGRQKGLSFILGTQDLSQLRVNYGADYASSLIGNTNTKLILRTVNDAENIAQLFNQSEVQEQNESFSYGVNDNRDGVSISKQRNMQSLILPSEFQSLDDLEGFLRFPGSYPVTKIKLSYVQYPKLNEGLIAREGDIDLLIEPEIANKSNANTSKNKDSVKNPIDEKNLNQEYVNSDSVENNSIYIKEGTKPLNNADSHSKVYNIDENLRV